MTFACLSEAEVREKYRRAEDKEHMIIVLAQLTNSTSAEMRAFLGVGAKDPKPPAKKRVILDAEEAARLHSMGLTDKEIAERLRVSDSTVRRWRWKNGIPYNSKNDEVNNRRMELYNQGLTDREIAERVGLGTTAIFVWRRTNNLPSNHGRGGNHRKPKGDKR